MSCNKCYMNFCWFCLEDWSTHQDHFYCRKYGVGKEGLTNTPVHHNDEEDTNMEFQLFQLVSRFTDYQTSKTMAKKKADQFDLYIQQIKDHHTKTRGDGENSVANTFLLCIPLLEQCRSYIQYMIVAQAVEKNETIVVKIQAQQETLETVTERLARIVEVQLLAGKKEFPELKTLVKVAQQFVQSLVEQDSW